MSHRLQVPRNDDAPAVARKALDELPGALAPQLVADAQLLVSELVTNSVLHGSGDTVTLIVDVDGPARLRCEVIDNGDGFVPRARVQGSTGGWGLELVETLSASWGVREGSTHVWFELVTDRADSV